jgi:hypothetical protein
VCCREHNVAPKRLKFLFAEHRTVCGLAAQRDLFIAHGIGGSRSGRSRQNDTSIVMDLLRQLAVAGVPTELRSSSSDMLTSAATTDLVTTGTA